MKDLKEQLEVELKPLYQELVEALSFNSEPMIPCCVEWGKSFKPGKGILFIGKARNGGDANGQSVEEIFHGVIGHKAFNKPDQMKWMVDAEGQKGYNSKDSAFIRLLRKVSLKYYNKEDWFNQIAWSNLYKKSPSKGNPSKKMMKSQNDICARILDAEIKILKPKYVVFLTSGWEHFYINKIGLDRDDISNTIKWDKYELWTREKDDITYIMSYHPQGKNSDAHRDAILSVLA